MSRLVKREGSWQVDDKLQFLLKRKTKKGNPLQRSAKAQPFLNRFISFSTFSHLIFRGSFKTWPDLHSPFIEEKNKSAET